MKVSLTLIVVSVICIICEAFWIIDFKIYFVQFVLNLNALYFVIYSNNLNIFLSDYLGIHGEAGVKRMKVSFGIQHFLFCVSVRLYVLLFICLSIFVSICLSVFISVFV